MNQQELLKLIDRAAAEGWTELDLSGKGLTELPPEIGQLTNMKALNLWSNRLKVIPPEIGNLSSLTTLNLGGNQLTTVPLEIGQLTNLTELALRGNLFTTIPSEIFKLTNLTDLNLTSNLLTGVSPEIGQLTNLAVLSLGNNQLGNNQLTAVAFGYAQLTELIALDLSSNQLSAFPPEITQLPNLSLLNLSNNHLTHIPSEIGQLAKLARLYLVKNRLTNIPPEIGQLTSLTELSLYSNRLTNIPLEIGQLTSLTKLDLNDNELIAVPLEIGQLTSLTELKLNSNKLTELPSEIGKLSKLITLNLGNHVRDFSAKNYIRQLPSEIGQLKSLTTLSLNDINLMAVPIEIKNLSQLTKLDLRRNSLTAIPQEIGRLINLSELHLNSNELTHLPPEIGQLANLVELHAGFNKLASIPQEIGQLKNLTNLYLRGNRLTSIPFEIGQLTNLTHLSLRSNQLDHLSITLQKLTSLKELDLRSNSALDISAEVLAQTQSPSLILRAYFGKRHPLHEAKMLLVGQGGVGKTALARRLIHDLPPDREQGKTPGVDIQKWSVVPAGKENAITLNLWDFGGQGVYQATHQFFFTSRSLYLVVINARTGEQESRLRHWLKLVGSLSDNAPVIIVVNKQDEHTLTLNERELMHKYPNLLHIIPTSCITGQGIPELREAIAAALNELPHINDQFPVAWFDLKMQLEAMDSNYITYEQYADYCREAGIDDRTDQRSWVQVLHQLGVVLSYQDRHLQGTHVLKPEWVTDGVYRILSDPDNRIANNNGILTASILDNILDPDAYPGYQQQFIVDMMRKFELSFPIPNTRDQYLIPDLLPKEQPVEAELFQKTQLLNFQIHYTDFLPDSIISRFMVGMMASLDRQASWRHGAVLKFDGNSALVRADLDARKIFITIAGAEATRRSLLNSIRMQLHAIHSTFPNLPLTEHIPIPNHPDKTIAYHALCNLEAKGIERHYDPVNDVDLDVKMLLDGIETPTLRRERKLQDQLLEKFNLEELRQLCFDLNVEFEDLPGETRGAKTRELVQFMGRRDRLDELEAWLQDGRGFVG